MSEDPNSDVQLRLGILEDRIGRQEKRHGVLVATLTFISVLLLLLFFLTMAWRLYGEDSSILSSDEISEIRQRLARIEDKN